VTSGNVVDPIDWLLKEGLVPLFGASVLYVVLRSCAWVMATGKKQFAFFLKEALDPMGWLYGGAVLSIQTWMRTTGHDRLRIALLLEAAVCILLLLVAMTNRAESRSKGTHYEPPSSGEWAAGLLVAAILYTGLRAYTF
jgi:hypothetical protein